MTSGFEMFLTGLVVIAASAIAAIVAALVVTRDRDSTSPNADETLADLDERRQQLVTALRDLAAQHHRMPAASYDASRDSLEHQAAQVLATRDKLIRSMGRAASPSPSGAVPLLAGRPRVRAALWAGGTVLVVAAAVGLASAHGTVASDAFEGDEASTDTGARAESPRPQNPVIDRAMAELRQDPNNLAALTTIAHELIMGSMFGEARPFVDRALQLDPDHSESRVHYGALLAAQGNSDGALRQLDLVLKAHPDFAEGWFFRGVVGMQSGNNGLMQESLREYVVRAPEGPQKEWAQRTLRGQNATKETQ